MQLTLTHLTYSYEDALSEALAPVSATLPEGWTGIVGTNGCGKSTLLRLICGELVPALGQIIPKPSGIYCPQETEFMPGAAEDFTYDYSGEALRIKRMLDIEDDWIWRYNTLSQGERKRLQVGVALWQNPLVLALDEPTNHVDEVCRAHLQAALLNYKGVGLLVSHDRALLDALVRQCLFMGTKKAVMRPGTYSAGREQERADRVLVASERKAAKTEMQRLQQVKVARDNEAARANARRSKKNIAKGDKDAKSRIDLAIYTGQDGKAGKRSAQMDARVTSAEQRLAEAQVEKQYSAEVWLDAEPSHKRVLVELEEGCLAMGTGERLVAGKKNEENEEAREAPHACLRIPHLAVGPREHIALAGPNGAGKSTLITALVNALPSDVRTLYLPQELSLAQRKEQLAALQELPQDLRGRALSIVAQLNSNPDKLLSGGLASPGETRKLMLALGILAHPQLIIMDEPTNHLDLISTEALERLLAACPSALVLVSHDKQFLAAATSISWNIAPVKEGSKEGQKEGLKEGLKEESLLTVES